MISDKYNSDSKQSFGKKALAASLLVGCVGIAYTVYDKFQTETTQFEMEDVVNTMSHTLIQSRRYCGHDSTPEQRISNLDGCKTHCQSINTVNQIKGYWWKAWGGGYCGCCTNVDNLTTNWPDASVYSLPITHDLIANKRYCGHHSLKEKKISNVNDCQTACLEDNEKRGDIQGYWWKAWGGGYCGCCTDVNHLTTNWPDASVYRLPGAQVAPAAVSHDLIANKRYCGHDSTKEQKISNVDDCKSYCEDTNQWRDIKGYWWKAWGGGYCGCCTNVDNLTSNWPDASVYRIAAQKPSHDLIANRRYCGHHSLPEMKISNLDDCKMACKQANSKGNIKGYWWKAWGGGYCGCCTDVDHLTSNWPDASVYRIPSPQ